jgi:hypothetical protein
VGGKAQTVFIFSFNQYRNSLMPLTFMTIETDWNNAIGGLPAANPAGLPIPGLTYSNADDDGGTMVYLNFRYQGEDFHISVPLAEGGIANSFHVTSETATTNQLEPNGRKGGTTYTVKNKPSYYYDFTITAGPAVSFTPATKAIIIGKKTQKVENAGYKSSFLQVVRGIMQSFIIYMYNNGNAQVG